VAGALLMTRWKPRRLLLAGTLCVFPPALPSAALAVRVLCAVMFVTGVTVEVFGVSWMTALHQEIPEEKLSRVAAYDWFGSVALVPPATALAGPAEAAFERTSALCVPDLRNLRRRTKEAAVAARADSADAESPVGGLG
jgi:hypothetical protein